MVISHTYYVQRWSEDLKKASFQIFHYIRYAMNAWAKILGTEVTTFQRGFAALAFVRPGAIIGNPREVGTGLNAVGTHGPASQLPLSI